MRVTLFTDNTLYSSVKSTGTSYSALNWIVQLVVINKYKFINFALKFSFMVRN
jgi:hypothetical protein